MSRAKSLVIPNSENEFLSCVLASIKRRSKSLKYHSWELKIERVFEEYENERCEKLEVKLKPSDYNAWIEMGIWEDRWVTVSCWERTKENKWDWFYEGKLLPNVEGQSFVCAIEETNAVFFGMTSSNVDVFRSVWSSLLAKGPQLVR